MGVLLGVLCVVRAAPGATCRTRDVCCGRRRVLNSYSYYLYARDLNV